MLCVCHGDVDARHRRAVGAVGRDILLIGLWRWRRYPLRATDTVCSLFYSK